MRPPEDSRDDNFFWNMDEERPAKAPAPERRESEDIAARWARFDALLAEERVHPPEQAEGAPDTEAPRRPAARRERRESPPERALAPAPAAARPQPPAPEARGGPPAVPPKPRRDGRRPAESFREEAHAPQRDKARPRPWRRRGFALGALFGLLLSALVLGGLIGAGWVEARWTGPASPAAFRDAFPLDRLGSLLPGETPPAVS